MTLNEIQEDLKNYLTNLGIKRTTVTEALINMLAYAIYVDDTNRLSFINTISLPLSNSVNSKLFHASNSLYPVYRGTVAKVKMTNMYFKFQNIDSISKLTKDTEYLGYYFYYLEDYTELTGAGRNREVNLAMSRYPLKEYTFKVTDSEVFIDLLDCEDVSDTFFLFDVNGNDLTSKCTTDANTFFTTEDYNYLIITIKNFSVRIIRKLREQWESTSYTIKYIKYSENQLTESQVNNLALTYFNKTTDTKISIIDYDPRIDNLNNLTNNIMCYQSGRDIIGTTKALETLIQTTLNEIEGSENTIFKIADEQETNTCTIWIIDSTADSTLLDEMSNKVSEAIETMDRTLQLQLIKYTVSPIKNYEILEFTILVNGAVINQENINTITNNYQKNYINKSFTVGDYISDITRLNSKITSVVMKQNNVELNVTKEIQIGINTTADPIFVGFKVTLEK